MKIDTNDGIYIPEHVASNHQNAKTPNHFSSKAARAIAKHRTSISSSTPANMSTEKQDLSSPSEQKLELSYAEHNGADHIGHDNILISKYRDLEVIETLKLCWKPTLFCALAACELIFESGGVDMMLMYCYSIVTAFTDGYQISM
jgi:hypothetical protein